MRKGLATALALALMLSLAACANTSNGDNPSQPPSEEPAGSSVTQPSSELPSANGEPPSEQAPDGQESSSEKILIAYFTRIGNTNFNEGVDAISSASLQLVDGELKSNTQLIAEMIHSEVGADMHLIETTHKYPTDYDALLDFANNELSRQFRPELSTQVENMEDYEIVFLGFPNWWYDMPMAIYSFVEEYDLSGKTIIPFCTHGGSRFSSSIRTLRDILSDSTVLDGLSVRDSRAAGAQSEVSEWLAELNLQR